MMITLALETGTLIRRSILKEKILSVPQKFDARLNGHYSLLSEMNT